MIRSHVKLDLNFGKYTAALDDAERGRLIMAILHYAETGELPELTGRESVLWPVFQVMVDEDTQAYATKVEQGRKAAREAVERKKQAAQGVEAALPEVHGPLPTPAQEPQKKAVQAPAQEPQKETAPVREMQKEAAQAPAQPFPVPLEEQGEAEKEEAIFQQLLKEQKASKAAPLPEAAPAPVVDDGEGMWFSDEEPGPESLSEADQKEYYAWLDEQLLREEAERAQAFKNQTEPTETKNEEKRIKNEDKRMKNEERRETNTPLSLREKGGGEGESAAFQAFFSAYPKKQGRFEAWQTWQRLNPDEDRAQRILSTLKVMKGSYEWGLPGGRLIPTAAQFLLSRDWAPPPMPDAPWMQDLMLKARQEQPHRKYQAGD